MQIDTTYRSKHFSSRDGAPIRLVVVHATAGTNSLGWLIRNPQRVSANYLIRKDGWIYELVPTELAAHHAGYSRMTIDGTLYSGSTEPNINQISIGIELENKNDGKDPYPDVQIAALRWLLSSLDLKHPQTLKAFHRDIDQRGKTDPRGLDWSQIIREETPMTRVIGVEVTGALRRDMASDMQCLDWLKKYQAPLSRMDGLNVYAFAAMLNIDPSFVFAIWRHETSKDGKIGASDLFVKSNNAGAIRAYGRWPSVEHNGALWNAYESPQLGLMALVLHLKQFYGANGLLDVETIIPKYAPAVDGNKPASYIKAVLASMAEMKAL